MGIRGIRRLLHWRPLVFVGHFSYSIYLIHDPVLRVIGDVGEHLHLSAFSQYIAALAFGPPSAVFCGYLLYWSVERHFIRSLPIHSR